jgi:hypothetical protein
MAKTKLIQKGDGAIAILKDNKYAGTIPSEHDRNAPTASLVPPVSLEGEDSAQTVDYDALSAKVANAKTKALTKDQCERIFNEAFLAGKIAGDASRPVPMIVGSPSTPLGNDVDPNQKTWFIEGGVCGFAWIKVNPARGAFVNWHKANREHGYKGYNGGYEIHEDGGYGQSMQRKEAFCAAFAEVLRSYGIDAYMQSRMD